jgi:hypothetical protein
MHKIFGYRENEFAGEITWGDAELVICERNLVTAIMKCIMVEARRWVDNASQEDKNDIEFLLLSGPASWFSWLRIDTFVEDSSSSNNAKVKDATLDSLRCLCVGGSAVTDVILFSAYKGGDYLAENGLVVDESAKTYFFVGIAPLQSGSVEEASSDTITFADICVLSREEVLLAAVSE